MKVQYPGAAKALAADLDQIRRMGRMFGSVVPGLDIKPLLDELRDRMVEELDYRLEAQAQAAFATAYRDDPEITVPDCIAQAEHVLVTDWLDGTPLSRIIATGSQEERDAAGELYVRFLFSGPARARMLHADPHPGNYRITADGRLGVLDFGAVARMPDGLPPSIGRLLSVAVAGDASTVLQGLRREGFVKERVDLDPEVLLAYLSPFVEPAQQDWFEFSRAWMRGQFTRLSDPRQENWSTGLKLNLPPEYLLVHRVWLGGVGVLCQLEATVPVRGELERWVPGFAT